MTDQALPAVLTVAEVKKALRLSNNAVHSALHRGEIPSIKIGRRILIPREAFEQMLAGGGKAA